MDAKRMIEQGIPFAGRTEVEVLVMEPGYVKLKMPLQPNLNHVGTMYAGALFTLAELPGGAIFLTTFDAAQIQDEATEVCKADYSWDCELRDESGQVVCVSSNRYQLRSIQPPGA